MYTPGHMRRLDAEIINWHNRSVGGGIMGCEDFCGTKTVIPKMKRVVLWALLWQPLLNSVAPIELLGHYPEYGDTTIIYKSLIEPPFLFNRSDIHTRRKYSGFIPDLVHLISERLRRPYRLYLVPYQGYGVPDPKAPSGWTGLIGDVISGIADVAAAPMTRTFSREAVVDFSIPFMESGIAALYLYRNTLDGASWPGTIDSPLYFSDKDVEVICINGSLTYYYIESERLRATTVGSALRHMLRRRPKKLVWTKAEGIRRVIESRGSSVFLLEKPFADYISANEIGCRLRSTVGVLNMKHAKHYSFAMRKGDPLLESVNAVVDLLTKDGSVSKLRWKWWRGKCSPKTRYIGDKSGENFIEKKTIEPNDMLMDDNVVSSYLGTGVQHVTRIVLVTCCSLLIFFAVLC